MGEPNDAEVPGRLALHRRQRRVLGVLIEKGLTTPEYYPMTLKALVTGCNQLSNRDPVTHYSEEEVEQTLEELSEKGLVLSVIASTGRSDRWRQELGKRFELRAIELALIGELLLRGPQAEGELRSRAQRMRPIPTIEDLRGLLEKLRHSTPPFTLRLSPEEQQRGVRHTHAFYPEGELAEVRAAEGGLEDSQGAGGRGTARSPASRGNEPSSPREDELWRRLEDLENRVRILEERTGP
jgi:hypothetical protein